MQTRHSGGGERINTGGGFIGRSSGTSFTQKYDKVDYELVKQWGMNCLHLLKNAFDENDDYYIEFKQQSNSFNSNLNYSKVKSAFSVLKAAKDDYENNYFVEDGQENIIASSSEKTEFITNNCDEEAKRNTRIYLIIIFVNLALISLLIFSYFGIKYASFITFGLLIISFILSAIFLKEWTPTKLPERLLEHEKDRIYKRFGVNMD